LAGLVAYGICRLLGERGAKFILGEKDYRRGHDWFEQGGGWLVCISRALPILPEVVACTAGLVGMSFRRFVVALACGSLPMGFVFAAIGGAGHDRPGLAMGMSLVVPAILWAVARLLIRKLEKRQEEK
ncbi:MAG: VTT domain-containing protein, partial [Akkermansiaceae bacterium]|nr:VTT domain-containing protein [Akkermansiaceae bacterium]